MTADRDKHLVSNDIAVAMEDIDLSAEQVAALCGITPAEFSEIMDGDISAVDFYTLKLIQTALANYRDDR